MSDIAIKVNGLSKRYRIGLKEEIHDTLVGAAISFIKSPLKNLKQLRRLSSFEDGQDEEDVIWALRDVSFEVKKGEVVGVIGRNGAGKSTLLKILSGITFPTMGRAEIDGRVASLLEVGTGFHHELTGRENVYLNGTILGMTRKEIDRKFDEIVIFSGVGKFIDTPVKRYSSGMQVRLAFSVAAHLEAEVLLIDEVLAVGDIEFQKKCLGKMDEVAKGGRTVLFVSHNMGAVSQLCGRGLLIENGHLKRNDEITEVIETYKESIQQSIPKINPVLISSSHKRRGSGKVQIQEIELLDETGKRSNYFSVWEPFVIKFLIRNNENSVNLAVCRFTVSRSDGMTIGSSLQYDSGRNLYMDGLSEKVVTAKMLDNNLKPGVYYLTVGVLGNNREILDWCDDITSFEIKEGFYQKGVYDNRVGQLAFRSEWLEKDS